MITETSCISNTSSTADSVQYNIGSCNNQLRPLPSDLTFWAVVARCAPACLCMFLRPSCVNAFTVMFICIADVCLLSCRMHGNHCFSYDVKYWPQGKCFERKIVSDDDIYILRQVYQIFKNWDEGRGLDWSGSGHRKVACACECGNELLGFVQCGEFSSLVADLLAFLSWLVLRDFVLFIVSEKHKLGPIWIKLKPNRLRRKCTRVSSRPTRRNSWWSPKVSLTYLNRVVMQDCGCLLSRIQARSVDTVSCRLFLVIL